MAPLRDMTFHWKEWKQKHQYFRLQERSKQGQTVQRKNAKQIKTTRCLDSRIGGVRWCQKRETQQKQIEHETS